MRVPLKNLELLDEAIADEDGSWGSTPEGWEIHLEILIAGGAIEEDLSLNDIITTHAHMLNSMVLFAIKIVDE
nr:4403_t:CDS:2 [Entrophospora candida]